MELRHLRYLVAIADCGTFVRAAERLLVAQPALTRQIHDLEEELGVELFDPKARKATLTVAGEACVRIARHVIQDTERAVGQARLSNSGDAGRCTLAVGPLPVWSGIVSRFLARMQERFPAITVVVAELAGGKQWEALERAEADVGLGVSPRERHPALMMETQVAVAIDHAIVASGDPLAAAGSLALKDLRDIPFLALEHSNTDLDAIRVAVIRAMEEHGFPQRSIKPREFSTVESVLAHVRAGQGWTLAPAAMAARAPGVARIRLTDFRAPLRLMRIWRRAENRPVVHTVVRELRLLQQEEHEASLAGAADARPAGGASREGPFVPARLDLRHLRSFAVVAQHGSLGRGAEILEITQPALSRQMRELEYDVGVALLERGTRGVSLTPAGDTFARDVRSVLSIVDHLPREVVRATRATAQRCVIACVPHPHVDRLLTDVMVDLESRSPRVRVGTRSIPTPQQGEALRNGEIDIGVGHAYPVMPEMPSKVTLVTRRLFHDRICTALLADGHPFTSRGHLRLRDLADMPLLWVNRQFFPRFYDAVSAQFAAAGFTPRLGPEQDGLATLWSMTAQGLGWTLGWESHLTEPPVGVRAIRLQDFHMEWGGAVTYRQDESRAPILTAIDAILAHANELFGGVKAPEGAGPSAHTSPVAMS